MFSLARPLVILVDSVRAVSFVLLPANRWDSCLLGRSSRFAITSFIVWYCAEKVYPNRVFKRYALLGDDLVIGDPSVAEVYRSVIVGVKISLPKSLISDSGACTCRSP